MPLEFPYYTKQEPYDDAWYIQNILSWDKNYRKYITYENIFLILLQTKLRDFLAPIKSLLFKNESPIYSSKNLNQWGDFCIQQTSQFDKKDHFSYLEDKPILSQFFISEIKRAKKKLNAIGANLVLTYPPTLSNSHFDLNQQTFADSINYIKAQLSSIGIEIIGEAKDFHYPPNLFLDTQYHLNCKGSIKRSKDFARVLNQWFKTR